MDFQLKYKFAITEEPSITQNPANRAENLCNLLATNCVYVELIFGELFNNLKSQAFKKACYKIYAEDSDLTYFHHQLQTHITYQNFYNKCPCCKKKYKCVGGSNYYSGWPNLVEPINSGWTVGKLLLNHLEKKHNISKKAIIIKKDPKYYSGRSLFYRHLSEEFMDVDEKDYTGMWRALDQAEQLEWTKKAKAYNAKYLKGRIKKFDWKAHGYYNSTIG
tara:strand:+ start:1408 stop:2064 length:657 start_codon:yes stop_codon:yes gene_type:complete